MFFFSHCLCSSCTPTCQLLASSTSPPTKPSFLCCCGRPALLSLLPYVLLTCFILPPLTPCPSLLYLWSWAMRVVSCTQPQSKSSTAIIYPITTPTFKSSQTAMSSRLLPISPYQTVTPTINPLPLHNPSAQRHRRHPRNPSLWSASHQFLSRTTSSLSEAHRAVSVPISSQSPFFSCHFYFARFNALLYTPQGIGRRFIRYSLAV